jgi:hypothetical protein
MRSANRTETGGLGLECTTAVGMAREAASESRRSSTGTAEESESGRSTGSQTPSTRPANVNPASKRDAAETKLSADLRISIPLIVSPQLPGSRRPRASSQRIGLSWPRVVDRARRTSGRRLTADDDELLRCLPGCPGGFRVVPRRAVLAAAHLKPRRSAVAVHSLLEAHPPPLPDGPQLLPHA